MDSTTLLAKALDGPRKCHCVTFKYPSKHGEYENAAAQKVAYYYDIPLRVIDLSSFMKTFKSNLLKGQGEIPEGHYEEKTMEQTVVPGRNIIFSSILSGYAWSIGASQVWLGAHEGDHAIYDDCREVFIASMNQAIRFGTGRRVELVTPFLKDNKTSIIKYGLTKGVPYHLTRTCYKDQEISCGRCGSCCERREAFINNGVEDPIEYEYEGPLPKKP